MTQHQRSTTIEEFLAATPLSDLTPDTTPDERLRIVESIASSLQATDVSEVFRVSVRGEVIAALKATGESGAARLYDSAIRWSERTGALSSPNIIPTDPEPWPDPVDGSELVSEIADHIERFLVLPHSTSIVLAAWIMATWCVQHLFVAPILAFLSPTKQSGKTLALSILRRLVMRPLSIADVTTAGRFG